MKCMKGKICFLLISFFVLFVGCTSALISKNTTSLEFKEILKNEESKEYHRILIAGEGDIKDRLLFDEIVEPLSAKFSAKSITTEHLFIPKNENEEMSFNEKIKQHLLKNKYDATLFITANQTTIFTRNDHVDIPVGNYLGTSYSSYTRANSKLYFRMYDTQNLLSEIWMASINIDADLTNKPVFKSIANKIIESFISTHLYKK